MSTQAIQPDSSVRHITEERQSWWHIAITEVEQRKAQHMSMAVGKVQVAIWRTEEAIEMQKVRIAEETDPLIVEMERRSLITLEDVLYIHRRTLDFMLEIPERSNYFYPVSATQESLH